MIQRLVLDVLKPHDPGLIEFTEYVESLDEVSGVTSKLVEIEENVRTIRVAIEGEGLDPDRIEAEIADIGGSIHSIDEVSAGERIVDDRWLPRR